MLRLKNRTKALAASLIETTIAENVFWNAAPIGASSLPMFSLNLLKFAVCSLSPAAAGLLTMASADLPKRA
jgi:hypothetical protein